MEQNPNLTMLTTQEFIKMKCNKDHLVSPKIASKHSSIYHSHYHPTKHDYELVGAGTGTKILRQPAQLTKISSEYLAPLSSVYRRSFQKNQAHVPEKGHQKPSFFLKAESIEPFESSYRAKCDKMTRSIHENENNEVFKLQKAKPRMDSLSVPKYNKMTTKSLYQDTIEAHTKLPHILTKKRASRRKSQLKSFFNYQNLRI